MKKRHGMHVILEAITPSHTSADAEQLIYPNLHPSSHYFSVTSLMWRGGNEIMKSYRGFKTSKVHEDMQVASLLTAAYRLQSAVLPPSKLFWSAQFTTRSIALFGRPMRQEVARLACLELQYFEAAARQFPSQHEFFEPVLRSYRLLSGANSSKSRPIEERYQQVMDVTREYFWRTYVDVFAGFGVYARDAQLSPQELKKSFEKALVVLCRHDQAWSEWTVEHDDTAKLSVDAQTKRILIGRNRNPLPVREVRGLFAHEVLVHAQRALRGSRKNKQLGLGLPGYVVAEEGLGVLVESAINHGINTKVTDRYIDIALALGTTRRRPYTRQELYVFCYSRQVIRRVVSGEELSLREVEAQAWEHVNRIYKGSLGNHYVGVFTKDISYYKGFKRIAGYVQNNQQKLGSDRMFEYLLQGKFDPTNLTHKKYLSSP